MSEHPRQELAPGMTYRQLDYWTRIGLIFPENGATPGSGRPRKWSGKEIAIARTIGLLRLEGVELATAARMARVEYETTRVASGLGWSF